ncbi:MAG: hypothetical protein PUI31_00760 [Clostridia bacterium]|nr:hypothetical protein [Clostridiales bacterium]MDD7165199.1 hypothetical protein [Clostridia bacterium]MDY2901491.1 hypothetical protein [Christensenellaceae bacterium]
MTGKIITLVITYFLLGIVIGMDQTKQAQANFIEFLKSKNNGLCNFLITIRIETILTAVIVFIAVMILQLIVVNVLAGLLSIDGAGAKFFNSILGVLLGVAECAALVLIVLEAMYIFGGGAESVNLESLKGSFFGLDTIYLNNPLSAIFRI